jgi:hypothetical protein
MKRQEKQGGETTSNRYRRVARTRMKGIAFFIFRSRTVRELPTISMKAFKLILGFQGLLLLTNVVFGYDLFIGRLKHQKGLACFEIRSFDVVCMNGSCFCQSMRVLPKRAASICRGLLL